MTINTTPHNSEHLTHPKYRADIDGLRALAILCVVGFHAFPEWLKGGFIGVDIFFVISGYLISTIIIGSLERNSFSFVEFYIRRINRIFPALLFVLISCFVFGWFSLLADEYKQLGKHIAGGGGFISNFILWNESGYFDTISETKPLLHLWSLGIEEQFYIVWPVMMWFAWKRNFNLMTITIVVSLVSFGFNLRYVNSDVTAAFYSPKSRFWELLIGSALAYLTLHRLGLSTKPKNWLDSWLGKIVYVHAPEATGKTLRNLQSLLGAALVVIGVSVITREGHFPGWLALLPTLGAVLIISAGAQAWFNRVLSNPILVWFGLISFPLYLWHWPLLSFAHILANDEPSVEIRIAVVIISILFAWLTYKLIEQPIRFGNHGKTKTITLVILMAALGAVGYGIYKRDGLSHRKIVLNNPHQKDILINSNPSSECTNDKKFALVNKFCTKFAAENSKKTIVLWGDSSSAAWSWVFRDIAKEMNYTVIFISHPKCAPLLDSDAPPDALESNDINNATYCKYGEIQEQALELIKSWQPNLTAVIAAWNFANSQCKQDEKTNPIRDSRSMDNKVRRTVKRLENISQVVIFRSWPMLPKAPDYGITRIPFLQKISGPTFVEFEDFNSDNKCMNNVFDRLTVSKTLFFSPSNKVCSEKCVSILNSTRMYVDTYHITPEGSMQFRDDIEKMLK